MSTTPSSAPSFFTRVVQNDSTKRGVAGALAGLLIAVVSEALFGRS